MLRSIVEYYAEHERYKCGYCKNLDTNYSHGMWTHSLTAQDYQDLIDRGWRRSGKYCYKPTLNMTCCPMYTIRCQALKFKATKSQKKILKKFNKHLLGQNESHRKMSTCSSSSETLNETCQNGAEQFMLCTRDHTKINVDDIKFIDDDDRFLGDNEQPVQRGVLKSNENTKETYKIDTNTGNSSHDPNRAPLKKAKLLRRERKLEKLKQMGIDTTTISNSSKTKEKQLEDFINELPDDPKQKLQIKLVRTNPPSPEWQATSKQTHAVYLKYQTTVHDDEPDKCTESKFHDFLLNSPLLEEYSANGPPCGYGSFHQQYWLDGKLIAVGVIDILPKCVSSVYFFYDPDYMNLTLGTYGALREIEFTRYLHSLCPDIQYYYMGFYIHSCQKMRYKGNFHPSDLLCPETYKWFPLKDCIPKLELSPYSRLDPDIDSLDTNHPTEEDINDIPVWVSGSVMLYKVFRRSLISRRDDKSEVLEYARFVGAKTAKSLILVR